MTNPVDVEKAIKRTRAFKFYYDKGDAVANTEAEDAMALLSAYDTQAAENKRLTDIVEQPAQVIQKYLIENATQAAEIKRLMSELEQVKSELNKTATSCSPFVIDEDGTNLIPNYARIYNAFQRLTAELEAYERDAAKAFIAKHQEKSGFKTGEIIANLTAEIKRLMSELEQVNRWCKAFMPLAESHYKRQNAEHKTFCDVCRYWELADAKLQGINKE